MDFIRSDSCDNHFRRLPVQAPEENVNTIATSPGGKTYIFSVVLFAAENRTELNLRGQIRIDVPVLVGDWFVITGLPTWH